MVLVRHLPGLLQLETEPEDVAVMYMGYLLLKWMAAPSAENYQRMPECLRPLPIQIFKAHSFWKDFVPCLLVNWKDYGDKPVFSQSSYYAVDPESDEETSPKPKVKRRERWLNLNPDFEAHIHNIDNWTLGKEFRDAFPQWAHFVPRKSKKE
ncbi:hypothetical protein EJ06DRAFT_557825 [Trichodelitschia bisporula]|uniref:Uncharacterized protein n=1 Tax=Trichodelitschia bisporula TaxID=703511 RepID=A0A6G1HRG7_9PEZI|nr:hypothetical protein EJ06DRAFT_557825 [Trichodelitschia bisporula]